MNDKINRIEEPIITLDCDWAPDFVIKYVADLLSEYNIKATWFVTNDSPILSSLNSNPLFELGIHPNFDFNSTHGETIKEVCTTMKKIVPNAKSVRTHKLNQSTSILLEFQNFGIENDVSILLFRTPNIQPHNMKYLNLFRIPFFWEDDVQMSDTPKWDETNLLKLNGLKIFNFHPIHIFLNSFDMNNYNIVKSKYDLNSLNEETLSEFINYKNLGVKTMFKNMLSYLDNKKTFTISDVRRIYYETN